MRIEESFSLTGISIDAFKQQLLNWASTFNSCCFLDTHHYEIPHQQYDWMAAVDATAVLRTHALDALQQLDQWHSQQQDWLFGHLSFELANSTEGGHFQPHTEVDFPSLSFFVPKYLIKANINEGVVVISTKEGLSPREVLDSIIGYATPLPASNSVKWQQWMPRIPKEEYISAVEQLQRHIARGDCYEINFCQEFYQYLPQLNTVNCYRDLVAVSPTPFSAYYQLDQKTLMCASPERFLQKKGRTILSQPIKGTRPRNNKDANVDGQLKVELQKDAKERSENVMVVDLVRNDFSRICEAGTVTVEELFGVYSFPQVHQMISTIKGRLKPTVGLAEMLSACFPMGSMTGAPKHKVLSLIQQYENSSRGLYSGSVGYIAPNGDADFNVVIRSLQYNQANGYASYWVGSGITIYADPEKEYEECKVKAAAILSISTR